MSKTLDNQAVAFVAAETNISANQVISTCNLLFLEDCTVPFISRYRKEATGNLDEVEIRKIQDAYEEYLETEKRRTYIIETIEKMEQLTPELKKKILACTTLNQLEDLYAPYKSKKKTKATVAKEKGLDPLAKELLTSKVSFDQHINEIIETYVNKSEGKVKTIEEAITGATDILIEQFSHDADTKEELRQIWWKKAHIKSSKRKGAEEIKDYLKFKDFFEFEEDISQIKDSRNTHRFMAMRRGMSLKVLKLEIILEGDQGHQIIEAKHFPNGDLLGNLDLLRKVAKKAYDSNISTSLDLELKTELKKLADTAAIDVFGVNLKNLLLQPYLGSKAILGIDPGIRTGCKIVVIDDTGKFVGDQVIYPFAPKFDIKGSKILLDKLIETFDIKYIAIGNGTNGRETLEFVEDHLNGVKSGKVKATLISEAGASIYSASDIARKEFPDKDVTVRGAISIARRFQDPLAELVKIDPKSIGVGQYQHDVNQVKLKKSLTGVVEGCVNFVGVDLNTASAPLLSYISGIGPSVAENIVKYREKNKGFKTRDQLLKVPRFTNKVFEQSAGFLRIYNGDNPLDGTFIHPERYQLLETWAKAKDHQLAELITDKNTIDQLASDSSLKNEVGAMTFDDIVKSLRAPKQDPRSEFKNIEFRKDIRTINDLKAGTWYTGVVNNITNFGAFVDLGIKESGLLHISRIADEYIENPLDKLKLGQEVKVKVVDVDLERKRIGLSCKSDERASYSSSSTPAPNNNGKSNSKPKGNKPKNDQIKNNAFAGLEGLKNKFR